VFLRAVPVK
jgi:hypothetical protein